MKSQNFKLIIFYCFSELESYCPNSSNPCSPCNSLYNWWFKFIWFNSEEHYAISNIILCILSPQFPSKTNELFLVLNNFQKNSPSTYYLLLRYSFKIKIFPCVVLHFVSLILVMLMKYVVNLFLPIDKMFWNYSVIDLIQEAQGKMAILFSKLFQQFYLQASTYFLLGNHLHFFNTGKSKRYQIF